MAECRTVNPKVAGSSPAIPDYIILIYVNNRVDKYYKISYNKNVSYKNKGYKNEKNCNSFMFNFIR